LELDKAVELILKNPTNIGQEILPVVCLAECSMSLSRGPTSHRLILDKRLSHGIKGGGNVLGDVNFLNVRQVPRHPLDQTRDDYPDKPGIVSPIR
jgi:hypothetical protein